jgi:hypothetical protein
MLFAVVLSASGCTAQTEPATDVTPSTAHLNGTGTVAPGDLGGSGWWEYSYDGGQTWFETPHESSGDPSCEHTGAESPPSSRGKFVSGLLPNRHYVFRIAGTVCGSDVMRWDSTGTDGGTAFDSFDTGPGYSIGNWPDADWRPFNDNSPFNRRVDHSNVDPNSQAIVDWLTSEKDVGGRWTGEDCWDHPVYYSSPSDPLFTIHVTTDYTNPLEGTQVRIPEAARPACPSLAADPNTDAHLAVIDQSAGWEYDFWRVVQLPDGGGTLVAGGAGRTRIAGQGIWNPDDSPGADAANFALTAGSLRASEVRAGDVDHALFLVAPCVNGTVFPAHGEASQCSADSGNPGLKLGSRLFLDMSRDEIDALDISDWQKTILQALREYGGYIGDTGGGWLKPEGPETYTSFGYPDPWDTLGAEVGVPQDDSGHYVFNMRDAVDWRSKLQVAGPYTP